MAFYWIHHIHSDEVVRFYGDKKHFRVQQITNPGSSEDNYLSFENEETDLDQEINFQSDLLSSSGSSSSESSNNNE